MNLVTGGTGSGTNRSFAFYQIFRRSSITFVFVRHYRENNSSFTNKPRYGSAGLCSRLALNVPQLGIIEKIRQGVNTLWGSFEIKNTKLLKKMLQQYHGKPLHEVRSQDNIEHTNLLCIDLRCYIFLAWL